MEWPTTTRIENRPSAFSMETPTHCPLANSVPPTNRTTPGFEPTPENITSTGSPITIHEGTATLSAPARVISAREPNEQTDEESSSTFDVAVGGEMCFDKCWRGQVAGNVFHAQVKLDVLIHSALIRFR